MSLFPRKNPISIRGNYVEPGELIRCEICQRYLAPGTTYDTGHPRCSRCYFV